MQFASGASGNPNGRPKGSGGRAQSLQLLDELLIRKANKRALLRDLQKEFSKSPVEFFKAIVMPLLPKEQKLAVGADGVIEWRSLLGAGGENGKGDASRRESTESGGVKS